MSKDVRCLSCEIVQGGRQLIGGLILETAHYHAHQDVTYPVPGQVIVASKRHVRNLDELSVDQIKE
jgi:diadenosine tetraphosphate (Ap4A) HIT family hydrolase